METPFRLYTLEEARQGILRRLPPDEFEITGAVLDGIERRFGARLSPEAAVRRVIAAVRQHGDLALYDWTERIDGVTLDTLYVDQGKIKAAYHDIAPEVRKALAMAGERIEVFHRRQPTTSWIHPDSEGVLGQVVRPIARVGVYVPGGTAALPSSLLMAVIPARVAGVTDFVVCTPPGSDGQVPTVILAAAHIVGIERVYRLGGAQAIAAMAYGTETVPPVDKIVGPGNLFVTLAKRQVYGVVGIDGLLGPTETVVIADESADPGLVAADLLAQAEHDLLASAILITPVRELAEKVAVQIAEQIEKLPRAEIAAASLVHRGGAILVESVEHALEVANAYAPEHLQLSVTDPMRWLGTVQNAGAVFLGEHSFEVLGDYVAGPSHSLPTGGTARFSSGINVLDFVKLIAVIGLEEKAASQLSRSAAIIAEAEGLNGHAAAARRRIKKDA